MYRYGVTTGTQVHRYIVHVLCMYIVPVHYRLDYRVPVALWRNSSIVALVLALVYWYEQSAESRAAEPLIPGAHGYAERRTRPG